MHRQSVFTLQYNITCHRHLCRVSAVVFYPTYVCAYYYIHYRTRTEITALRRINRFHCLLRTTPRCVVRCKHGRVKTIIKIYFSFFYFLFLLAYIVYLHRARLLHYNITCYIIINAYLCALRSLLLMYYCYICSVSRRA